MIDYKEKIKSGLSLKDIPTSVQILELCILVIQNDGNILRIEIIYELQPSNTNHLIRGYKKQLSLSF